MQKRSKTSYSADIVIPCYHEEEALPVTIPKVLEYFRSLVKSDDNDLSQFRVLLIEDGSRDKTWQLIEQNAAENNEIEGIKLSRNFGHQYAMLTGLSKSDADVVITMDADL